MGVGPSFDDLSGPAAARVLLLQGRSVQWLVAAFVPAMHGFCRTSACGGCSEGFAAQDPASATAESILTAVPRAVQATLGTMQPACWLQARHRAARGHQSRATFSIISLDRGLYIKFPWRTLRVAVGSIDRHVINVIKASHIKCAQ